MAIDEWMSRLCTEWRLFRYHCPLNAINNESQIHVNRKHLSITWSALQTSLGMVFRMHSISANNLTVSNWLEFSVWLAIHCTLMTTYQSMFRISNFKFLLLSIWLRMAFRREFAILKIVFRLCVRSEALWAREEWKQVKAKEIHIYCNIFLILI